MRRKKPKGYYDQKLAMLLELEELTKSQEMEHKLSTKNKRKGPDFVDYILLILLITVFIVLITFSKSV